MALVTNSLTMSSNKGVSPSTPQVSSSLRTNARARPTSAGSEAKRRRCDISVGGPSSRGVGERLQNVYPSQGGLTGFDAARPEHDGRSPYRSTPLERWSPAAGVDL